MTRVFLLLTALAALACFAMAATPLNVTLYEESLCPDCMDFLVNQIAPYWTAPGAQDMMTLNIVPYGNAHTSGTTVTCQHGENECDGNRYELCAINQLNNKPSAYVPYILCVETTLSKDLSHNIGRAASLCAIKLGLNYPQLEKCATGTLGQQLLLDAGVATAALNPAHTYVPWVTVDGVHQTDAENGIWKYVCAHYTGTKASFCSSLRD
jgi:interferon gamma-inducible protein 30